MSKCTKHSFRFFRYIITKENVAAWIAAIAAIHVFKNIVAIIKEAYKMIIEGYDVKASSHRTFVSIQSTAMSAKRKLRTAPNTAADGEISEEDSIVISDHAKQMYKRKKDEGIALSGRKDTPAPENETKSDPQTPQNPAELKLRLLEMMLELLTGKKTRLKMQTATVDEEDLQNYSQLNSDRTSNIDMSQNGDGWELEHSYLESERISYQAQGIIQTRDDRTINVDMSMYMSNEFVSYMNITTEPSKAVDPLIINYGGTAASLLDEKFDFDLTVDAKPGKSSILGEGTEFLSVDQNGDGTTSSVSEFFGPSTENNFNGLRPYDNDQNGWIDEADDIFSDLLVLSRDKDGNDQVFTLEELGIGAIYLGDIDTQFSFKDGNNKATEVMRSSSFFLTGSGYAGTVSHVDLVI